MQEAKRPNPVVVVIIILVLLVAVAGGVVYLLNRQKDTNTEGATDSSQQQPIDTPSASSTSYKNGAYSATGQYLSPGGQESVDVEVTLKDDVIESATVVPHPASTTSTQYQGEFVNSFKPLVIGKNIDEVKLSRVAGSSLTSGGFNEALQKIKDDAAS